MEGRSPECPAIAFDLNGPWGAQSLVIDAGKSAAVRHRLMLLQLAYCGHRAGHREGRGPFPDRVRPPLGDTGGLGKKSQAGVSLENL